MDLAGKSGVDRLCCYQVVQSTRNFAGIHQIHQRSGHVVHRLYIRGAFGRQTNVPRYSSHLLVGVIVSLQNSIDSFHF